MSKAQRQSYQRRFREIRNLRLFDNCHPGHVEGEPIGSISRIEHKELSSSSDESPEISQLESLGKSTAPLLAHTEQRGNLLGKFCEAHPNNQSLNIEICNSVSENVSLQQVNRSFPNILSHKPGSHVSPLFSGKKRPACTSQEIGDLNQRIDYYEQRKAKLEAEIREQQYINSRRGSAKGGNLLRTLGPLPDSDPRGAPTNDANGSSGADRSFQKRENADTISLIENLRKPSDAKNLSLLGELEPQIAKDNFGDTSQLKCGF